MPKPLIFDPKELRPVREFIADGTLPLHFKTVERFSRDGLLPAIKVGNSWHSTPAAVRTYLWKSGNAAFRKLTA